MAIIFPDIEKTIVAYLDGALPSDVRVGTKKLAGDAEQPAKQVVVQVTYANDKTPVLRFAGVIVDVFADTYADASDLAFLVEARLRDCTGEHIKKVDLIAGPSRDPEETQQERRTLSLEVTVLGSDLP
jgi:hypothetical protein